MSKKLFKFKQSPVAGIDIDDTSVTLVSLYKDGQAYCLDSYAKVLLPKNAVVEKKIKDVEAVSNCLRAAITLSDAAFKYGAVALADTLVMTKIISVPKGFSEMEFDEQIIFEASKHIPYPLEEIYLDYHIPQNSKANSNNTAENLSVFIAASRKEIVAAYIQVLENVGLIPKLIDIESFVMQKACLAFVADFNINETIAIFDIGNTGTTIIVVYDRGIPIFTHAELFGSEILTKDIPQHLKRALQFYASTSTTKNISKFILTGELASLKELNEIIKSEFKIPVIVFDPLGQLKYAKKINAPLISQASSSLMKALGLVLRSFD